MLFYCFSINGRRLMSPFVPISNQRGWEKPLGTGIRGTRRSSRLTTMEWFVILVHNFQMKSKIYLSIISTFQEGMNNSIKRDFTLRERLPLNTFKITVLDMVQRSNRDTNEKTGRIRNFLGSKWSIWCRKIWYLDRIEKQTIRYIWRV